jgi:23S rRNA (guanosine2251-2'-O)-methyltransferase
MQFEKISTNDLGRMDREGYKEAPKIPVVLVLDNVRSAHNIGSIFRTCDAFRVEALYLCGICAVPPNKELMKTALGATETVAWKYFNLVPQALNELRSSGHRIISIEQVTNSTPLYNFEPGGKMAFVFGNEVDGVSDAALALSDQCIEIPQFGTKHSFNVSVTAGIVLWEVGRRINLAQTPISP